jgi:hypothetical protein
MTNVFLHIPTGVSPSQKALNAGTTVSSTPAAEKTDAKKAPTFAGFGLPVIEFNLSTLSAQPTSTNFVKTQQSTATRVPPQPKKAEEPLWPNTWQGFQQWVQKAADTASAFANTVQGRPTPEVKTAAQSPATTSQTSSGNWLSSASNSASNWASNTWKKITSTSSEKRDDQTATSKQSNSPASPATASNTTQTVSGLISQATALTSSPHIATISRSDVQRVLSQINTALTSASATGICSDFSGLLSARTRLQAKIGATETPFSQQPGHSTNITA